MKLSPGKLWGLRRLADANGLFKMVAIDQRTPLTYYAVAALFKLTGENNVWALHALAAALIAATALEHGMTVVTRNVADFESLGVPLLNPWARATDEQGGRPAPW